jgi:hypothetical protein
MLAAHQQLLAVRALSRLLRSKRFHPYSSQLRVNQDVYVHAQNKPGSAKDAVGWSRHRVVALHPSLAQTRPLHQKRGRPHMVSYADVRPIPADPIAQSAFVLALTAECTPSGRCLHGGDEDEDGAQDGAVGNADGAQDGAVGNEDGVQDGAVEDADGARDGAVARGLSSLLTASRPRSADDIGGGHADIGGVDVREPAHKETQPEVDTQALCEEALDVIGRDTVTCSHLSFLPAWFLDNALDEELDNWSEAVETGTWATFARPRLAKRHNKPRVIQGQDGRGWQAQVEGSVCAAREKGAGGRRQSV